MNIVQIVSDTFRRDFLGCYGNDLIHTENLDALAEKSIVFDRAYIASFPTIPQRTDLFTGKYTFIRAGWQPLSNNEVTLPQVLRQSGYTTMLVADTYHLIRDAHYFDRGFDGWWWIRGQESDRFMTHPSKDWTQEKDSFMTGDRRYHQNISLRRFEEDYFVAQTMASAAKWLELNYDQHKSFFLHIDTFDPHEPWDPPKWYSNMYDSDWGTDEFISKGNLASSYTTKELKHLRALYAGEVTLVDRSVGLLLEKIEDLGLFENTAIIFTTDHGTYLGEHGYVHKHAVPPYCHLYEEDAHIPLIIRMPDSETVTPGRCDLLVQPTDLMPTILELAGSKKPEDIEGRSMLPLIRGEKVEERDIAVSSSGLIFGQSRSQAKAVLNAQRMRVTSREWSLITIRSDAFRTDKLGRGIGPELYHLPTDPTEDKNLIEERRELADELHSKMVQFLDLMKANRDIIDLWKELQ